MPVFAHVSKEFYHVLLPGQAEQLLGEKLGVNLVEAGRQLQFCTVLKSNILLRDGSWLAEHVEPLGEMVKEQA